MKKFEVKDMDKMTGSPKQIAWAQSIRKGMIQQARVKADFFIQPEIEEEEKKILDLIVSFFDDYTDAVWYIDRRDEDIVDVMMKDRSYREAYDTLEDDIIEASHARRRAKRSGI